MDPRAGASSRRRQRGRGNGSPDARPDGGGGPGGAAPGQRIPPHDLEAEMSLLGSMCLSREAIGEVLPILPRGETHRFFHAPHRVIFEVLVDLYDRNEPIDLVTVKNELQRRNVLEEVGGTGYLVRLAETVPTWVNAAYYARIVRDKSLLRELIEAAGRIIDTAYADNGEAREILDRAEQYLFAVTDQRITRQADFVRSLIEESFAQLEQADGTLLTGLGTGFTQLDEMTCGLQPGELIIVAARPSMGKTAFGLCVAEHMAVDAGRPVAFFSMEMSRQQVAQRILCARGGVDSHRLRRGMLSDEEIQRLHAVAEDLLPAPLLIDDTPSMSLLELRAKARRLKSQHNIEAVFVDYLQLMHVPGAESRQQEIATVSRGLKGLARELHIPVIALAQLNRQVESREGNRPRMSDLRESGAIEQDADVVLLLHREEYYHPDDESVRGKAEIIVAKQRNGPTGTVHLHFNRRLTRFANLSFAPEPDYVPPPADDIDTPAVPDDADLPF